MTHEFCSIFILNTVKQGRSLTHMVSPDKIQHVRSKSKVSANCRAAAKGKKTFLAKRYGFCRCFITW